MSTRRSPGATPARRRTRRTLFLASGAMVLGLCWAPLAGAAPSTGAGSTVPTEPSVSPGPGAQCASTPADPTPGTDLHLSVTLGSTTATLSGTVGTHYGMTTVRTPHLQITTGGTPVFNGAVTVPKETDAIMFNTLALPQSSDSAAASNLEPLCLVKFAPNPDPTVLASFFTGGAHCCTIVRAYGNSANGWQGVDHVIGDPDASVQVLGGTPVLVTADDSFSYRFTDFAASADPVQVFEVRGLRFVDVSRSHRSVIVADAANWLQAEHQQSGDDLGLVAAWVADECRLGQQRSAYNALAKLEAQGKLTGLSGAAQSSVQPWPTGSRFVKALKTFLVDRRYCAA